MLMIIKWWTVKKSCTVKWIISQPAKGCIYDFLFFTKLAGYVMLWLMVLNGHHGCTCDLTHLYVFWIVLIERCETVQHGIVAIQCQESKGWWRRFTLIAWGGVVLFSTACVTRVGKEWKWKSHVCMYVW